MFNDVIAGVDGRDGGRDAVALARELVEDTGRLSLAHVHRSDREDDTDKALELLGIARAEMHVDADLESVAAASPAEGLHRLAAERSADLIAVGATRRDLLGRVVRGDDAHDALSGAPCAVAVAPRGYATLWRPIRRIGIGYDGSVESEHALGFARELACRFDATLLACAVVSLPSYAYPGAGGALATAMSDLLAEAERRLRALGGVEPQATYGVPAEELARFSRSVDLLVIGSRDYGAIGRLVHGSTAQQLAHTAAAPILVLTRATRAGAEPGGQPQSRPPLEPTGAAAGAVGSYTCPAAPAAGRWHRPNGGLAPLCVARNAAASVQGRGPCDRKICMAAKAVARGATRGEDQSDESGRQICCSMTSVLLKLIRVEGGEAALARVLADAGSERETAYLENVENWISLDEACALLEAGMRETGDPAFARRVGENTLRQHAGTQVATLLRSLGSTEAVLKAVASSAARLSAVTELEALDAEPGRGVVRACARDGFTRRPLHCDWTAGLLASTPMLFGLPLARVEESECQARGGEQCLYTVTWDADLAAIAADPQQRVTALEAQIVAMTDRLHGAYATAGDLVAVEDLDAVLQRIVERAADAVRAPSHILAVRTDPAADLRVFSHGIDARKAAEIAQTMLAGEEVAADSVLAVDVASVRQDYGQLIARYPGAVEFFPQDRELLSLYAKYAAAVLDMSVALEQSVRRHQQVSSLLSLAHAVAEAGSSVEIADRLVAVVPNVVDCDQVGVWLFDYLEQNIRPIAMSERTPEHEAYLRDLVISTDDTPLVREMLAAPKPRFLDAGTTDAYVRAMIERLGIEKLAVVPIVSRDVFLGVLTVSVSDASDRLRADSDLLDRVTGVAAIAATAIQNGQLVDKLRHKASHDALTGLLNRVGFRQHIDELLHASDGRLGLIYIDLDGFKQVNDTYGHDTGDEVIRKAAHRLESTARAGDGIARLGGDEFAVVLADVSTADQLAAAEARVRAAFEEPFTLHDITLSIGASVGGGVWLEDGQTIDELSRHADEAMYADKASGRTLPVEV